ncbi:MAG: transporter substrate-binding domain-containing protein [Deltaproteobacteria bacterium]|nr:transporter substrate-binding domain-containing protein [Deltaproteobacteria bacterium]
MFRLLILLVILLSGFHLDPSLLFAQDSSSDKTLIVGTKIAPPFAMKADDGSWEGISVELWDEIAKKTGP